MTWSINNLECIPFGPRRLHETETIMFIIFWKVAGQIKTFDLRKLEDVRKTSKLGGRQPSAQFLFQK